VELETLKDRVLRGGKVTGMELTGRHRKDGSLVDISLSAAPIQGPEGTGAILCIAEDITARRAGEAELRKLSQAVEQSPVSIVITDLEGNIEYVNPKFTELTGYARDEVMGKNPRILKSGEMPPEFYRTLWQTITSGGEWRGELRNCKKNGELFWEDASISSILDERGRITHFLAVKEDITARKALEAQYAQSQKMEAIGRLAGGVAHDFNNLLTVISGYTSLLLRDAARDSRPGMALAEIEAASKRAAALTQQLLAFGRRQVLQPRPLNLAAIVSEVETLLRRVIGEDVVFSTSGSPDLGTIVADPGQIEQVLLNLTVNARDAMPGGGRLEIETSNATVSEQAARAMPGLLPGEYVLLSVSDTGLGIPPEVLPHVFEPFFTTKEKGKGTGLGLATVYGIVKQSGGGIYADTEVGRGTTFRIYLPHVPEAAGEAPVAGNQAAVPRGSETILLVEDEGGVRNIVGRLLEDFGYHVISLSDPLEAIARMAGAGADGVALVLTDVVMPHMDGRTLSLRLREARPGLKILLMTGYMPDEALQAGGSGDGTPLLQKPFRPEQLARKVREVLDAKAAD
jgi:PAS domain S-box-containing protein